MRNITSFLSKSTIKSELAHVYVYDGYAVATDGYRLVEIKLNDYCTEHIKDGYYTKEKWVAMSKAYSKKKLNIIAFMTAIAENKVHEDMRKDYKYPDYKILMPKSEDLKPIDTSSKFETSYIVDFLTMIDSITIDLSLIKDNGKFIYYENAGIKMLLMKRN